jgi:hypothetical protein
LARFVFDKDRDEIECAHIWCGYVRENACR